MFNLILSGDVKENPGTGFRKLKCNQCEKTVISKCCKNYFHETCIKYVFVTVGRTFTCSDCFFYELLFRNCHLPVDNLTISLNYENFVDFNPYLEMLNNHRNRVSIAHLNTQRLLSTFDEFEVMLDTYEFHVKALTETRLRDFEHLINYVQISGYNFEYNNRYRLMWWWSTHVHQG